jgi:hypothetical protein
MELRRAQCAIPLDLSGRGSSAALEGGLVPFALCRHCMEQVPAHMFVLSDGVVFFCPQCETRLESPYWADRLVWEALGWHVCTPSAHMGPIEH